VNDAGSKKMDAAHLFLVLQKTYRALLARVEEGKKRMGLGDSDFKVLEALLSKGPLPVNVIGEMIDLTTGSITTAVDRMEAKWLVIRKNHPQDRRIRLVELTAKGRRIIERASVQHSADMEKAFATLSREERNSLADLLRRLSVDDHQEARLPVRALR
jgi:MarR family transcriptional regulator, 2-MHQ and catechol-resistance regulon repressor